MNRSSQRTGNYSMNQSSQRTGNYSMNQSSQRTGNYSMNQSMQRTGSCQTEQSIPTDRKQLFCFINDVSFAVNDIILYLDTHPEDMDALKYFHQMVKKRKEALKIYAEKYGPLTIDCAEHLDCGAWKWAQSPFPWERGYC